MRGFERLSGATRRQGAPASACSQPKDARRRGRLRGQLARGALALLALCAVTGCASSPVAVARAGSMDRASASAREFATAYELPPDLWTSTTAALEAHLERELPLPPRRTPSDAALDALADALDGDPRRATVAAVVLGRLAGARATETLLARLERRVEGPARADDAGDTTAAAALAARPLEPALLDRLALLAADDARAHPDLEVRVECALALLAHGRTDAVPFLLAVARHDTPLARARNEHLTDSPTTAWPRWRAASALEHWLDLPPRYDPDAPPATRAEIAATLERAATARSSR